ncbi:unnamed protein product [Nesidiocoris tenuis]|uniref:WWE domain-containing protein n=1 Tax=Nesidiocoris tenuis TaxID=355587 RepID=A0A6H5HFY2_9HEMI|nr:unnamed protein product [Nesidiocoris tenuis]
MDLSHLATERLNYYTVHQCIGGHVSVASRELPSSEVKTESSLLRPPSKEPPASEQTFTEIPLTPNSGQPAQSQPPLLSSGPPPLGPPSGPPPSRGYIRSAPLSRYVPSSFIQTSSPPPVPSLQILQGTPPPLNVSLLDPTVKNSQDVQNAESAAPEGSDTSGSPAQAVNPNQETEGPNLPAQELPDSRIPASSSFQTLPNSSAPSQPPTSLPFNWSEQYQGLSAIPNSLPFRQPSSDPPIPRSSTTPAFSTALEANNLLPSNTLPASSSANIPFVPVFPSPASGNFAPNNPINLSNEHQLTAGLVPPLLRYSPSPLNSVNSTPPPGTQTPLLLSAERGSPAGSQTSINFVQEPPTVSPIVSSAQPGTPPLTSNSPGPGLPPVGPPPKGTSSPYPSALNRAAANRLALSQRSASSIRASPQSTFQPNNPVQFFTPGPPTDNPPSSEQPASSFPSYGFQENTQKQSFLNSAASFFSSPRSEEAQSAGVQGFGISQAYSPPEAPKQSAFSPPPVSPAFSQHSLPSAPPFLPPPVSQAPPSGAPSAFEAPVSQAPPVSSVSTFQPPPVQPAHLPPPAQSFQSPPTSVNSTPSIPSQHPTPQASQLSQGERLQNFDQPSTSPVSAAQFFSPASQPSAPPPTASAQGYQPPERPTSATVSTQSYFQPSPANSQIFSNSSPANVAWLPNNAQSYLPTSVNPLPTNPPAQNVSRPSSAASISSLHSSGSIPHVASPFSVASQKVNPPVSSYFTPIPANHRTPSPARSIASQASTVGNYQQSASQNYTQPSYHLDPPTSQPHQPSPGAAPEQLQPPISRPADNSAITGNPESASAAFAQQLPPVNSYASASAFFQPTQNPRSVVDFPFGSQTPPPSYDSLDQPPQNRPGQNQTNGTAINQGPPVPSHPPTSVAPPPTSLNNQGNPLRRTSLKRTYAHPTSLGLTQATNDFMVQSHTSVEPVRTGTAMADSIPRQSVDAGRAHSGSPPSQDSQSMEFNEQGESSPGHYRPAFHHWFFKKADKRAVWQPFSMADSLYIEQAFISPDLDDDTKVPTDGGRYDVEIVRREKKAVYWEEEPCQVRRCSWFVKSFTDARYIPYDENIAELLEEEYKQGCLKNEWDRRIELADGEVIILNSPNSMAHHQRTVTPEDWSTSPVRKYNLSINILFSTNFYIEYNHVNAEH